ncbi:MAG: hypothetical protein OEZ01_15285, partial [Candidatus Heimdallarchaeota archaeon]|nr:hypothetical protein [Candidatus Heimdallarchaeota archaeon]
TGLGYVAYATAYFCYILSFLIVLAVSSFLHLAHAFFFAIIVFWGLLVIPLQITNTIKLLRPFGLALGIILMWPVFELIIMYFFKFLFINGSAEMINSIGNTYTIGDEATFYMAFTVMNCLILAIVTSVPFFTMALIQGTGLPGAIMSFALAGGAAGVAMFKSVAGPVTNAAKGGGDLFGSIPGTNKSGAATNFKSAMDGMSDSFGKTSMFDAVSNMQSDMDGLSTNNDSAGATSASPTSADDAMQAGSPSGGSSSVGTDSSGASFNSQTSSDEQELAEAGNDVGTNDSGVNKGKKAKHTKQAKRGAVINYDKTHNTQ